MAISILVDSCCDVTPALKNLLELHVIPLELRIGNTYTQMDDETLDPLEFLTKMKASREATSTACPSPEAYAAEMRATDACIVVTLSSKLSGSYNAAVMGRELVLEETPDKQIYVLDSESASAGQTRLALFLADKIREELPFDDIVREACALRDKMRTMFVLEDLSNLIKAGRISKAAGVIGSMLSLRPLMSENGEGEIICLEKIRGTANALKKLVQKVAELTADAAHRSVRLVISQCNCAERAQALKKDLLNACPALEDVLLVPTCGVSTLYANDGGIVIAF